MCWACWVMWSLGTIIGAAVGFLAGGYAMWECHVRWDLRGQNYGDQANSVSHRQQVCSQEQATGGGHGPASDWPQGSFVERDGQFFQIPSVPRKSVRGGVAQDQGDHARR